MSTAGIRARATLFDGKSAQGQDVAAALGEGGLVIATPDGRPIATWTRASLARTNVDAPDGTITLRRRGGPERLTLTDPAWAEALPRWGLGAGSALRWSGRRYAGLAGTLVAAVVLAALLIDHLPDLLLPLVPHSLERGWSATIEDALTIGQTRCTAEPGRAALADLLARLSRGAGVAPTPSFGVLDDPQVNAFTLPDGRIVILQGLIARAQDPDELAGVLAHELGHVKHRDPTREALRGLELNMLIRTMGWGGSLAGQMTALSYGRSAEAAADASALRTLRAAGLRADGLSRFFTLLHRQSGGDGLPGFLSNHPTTESRAERLRTGPSGETAMDQAAWRSVRQICGGSGRAE